MPLSEDEIQKKREEAERKARRGEIDPMHEYAFQVICQVGWIIGQKRDYLMKIDIKLPQLNKAYLFHGLGDRDIAPRADGVHV